MKNTTNSIRLVSLLLIGFQSGSAVDFEWKSHDREQPLPPVIEPGEFSVGDKAGTPPSDAIVLFDGKNKSAWVDMNGNPTKWIVKEGALECVPSSGYIRTLQSFGDCQLHVEWATPKEVKGNSQGRGNSGVFFGLGQYEIQVLDCYQNTTYADGLAGSLYGQYPPLVNACKAPGEWQTYDIIYTAPRFSASGELISPAYITAFHNGVLIQYHSELSGPTSWINRPPYVNHPEKLPLAFQDHGNPVRFRNVWVRELGKKSKPEFYLSESKLDELAGVWNRGHRTIEITRGAFGTLKMTLGGQELVLYATSEDTFFAKTTDVIVHFKEERMIEISVGE
ncbi:MAG: DUF1080 domain-containing protein [Opitutales bacterium]|nr:DUF1080 domain-containing protein [Opitutales bacterium]